MTTQLIVTLKHDVPANAAMTELEYVIRIGDWERCAGNQTTLERSIFRNCTITELKPK